MAKPALLRLSSLFPESGTTDPGQVSSRLPVTAAHTLVSGVEPEANDNETVDARRAPYALLVLRLALGAMFLQHVMRIVFGYEPADVSQLFALPAGVSAFALAWDTLIGLALLYGLWARFAAIAGAATLSLAAFAAHGAAAASAFAWQLPVFWIAALLAFALTGDGVLALIASGGRLARGNRQ